MLDFRSDPESDLDPLSWKRIRIRIKADPKYWTEALEAYPRFICSFFIYKMFVKLKLVFNHTLTKLTERSNVFEKEREEHTENIFFYYYRTTKGRVPPALPPSLYLSGSYFLLFFRPFFSVTIRVRESVKLKNLFLCVYLLNWLKERK